MKLTRVVLENFRCFERAEIDLTGRDGKPLGAALLVGPNGAGKSSVLAAIAGVFSLLGPYGGEFLGAGDLRQGTMKATAGVHFVEPRMVGEVLRPTWEFGRHPDVGEVFSAINLGDASFIPEWQSQRDATRDSSGLIVGFDAYRILPILLVDGPNIANVPRHRIEDSLVPTLRRDGQIERRFGQLTQWIVNIDFRRAKAKADRGEDYPAWHLLRQGLNRLLAPSTFEGVDDDNRVIFQTPNGRVPLEAMSDGFRSLFVIITELMMRLSMSTDDQSRMLEGEAVCLIDELDAHLHPRWQQNVLPGLRALFPNVQFIATTHSPLVVASAVADEVFYIGPEEDL